MRRSGHRSLTSNVYRCLPLKVCPVSLAACRLPQCLLPLAARRPQRVLTYRVPALAVWRARLSLAASLQALARSAGNSPEHIDSKILSLRILGIRAAVRNSRCTMPGVGFSMLERSRSEPVVKVLPRTKRRGESAATPRRPREVSRPVLLSCQQPTCQHMSNK